MATHLNTLYVLLHRDQGVVSRLIRWQQRSDYSHASLLLPDGRILEALQGQGVIESRRLMELATKDRERITPFAVQVGVRQAASVYEFAHDQTGKPYDWTMVVRFVSRQQESRKSSGKWFCSELVYAACQQAGVHLLHPRIEPWRVSPGGLLTSPRLEEHTMGQVRAWLDGHAQLAQEAAA